MISPAAIAVVVVVVAVVVTTLAVVQVRQVNRRFRMLDEVSRIPDEGGSLDETLDAIAAIVVPDLADICAIDVIEGDRVRRAAVRVAGPEAATIEAKLKARKPQIQEEMVSAGSHERQEPRLFEFSGDEALRDYVESEEDFEFVRALRVRSVVTVELRARGRPTGVMTISVGASGRRYRSGDVKFASVLAGRVALALDNAGLFSDLARSERERAEIAETLQRGLLPPPLPHIPGWSVAATYRPAGAENEIGGDFYDAFRIAGGWMVVIGDVTGRGAHAAAVTAHARYTFRTAAALTGDPVVALKTLNRELLARSGTALCGVAAVAVSDDPQKPVRLALAGHLPPLLVDGESVVEASKPAPVLGAFVEDAWKVATIAVEPGQQLVVVTDGVTDALGDEGRFGEERLRSELTTPITSPAQTAQRIEGSLHEFAGGTLDDDAAIVVIAPASADAEPAPEEEQELVERLYAAFNRRDPEDIVELCDEGMGFFPAGTAEQTGRTAPYVGPAGLQEYLRDVERVWDELLITPKTAERHAGSLLVRGRVYARSRALGIRDVPVAWIWDLHDGVFRRGEVFPDPEEAVQRLAAAS